MKLIKDNITKISFWKRNPQSISNIIKITIKKVDCIFYIQKDNQQEDIFDSKIDDLLNKLNDELIDDDINEYLAMKYENDTNDYVLKFFLEIDFKDYTYLAIKGTNPIHQKHYKEIMNIFDEICAQ